jgi:hypothetical protein
MNDWAVIVTEREEFAENHADRCERSISAGNCSQEGRLVLA